MVVLQKFLEKMENDQIFIQGKQNLLQQNNEGNCSVTINSLNKEDPQTMTIRNK